MSALQPFGPDIWIAEGPTVIAALGFHYPTRMAVIRLADGTLFIWSPIALNDALRAEVEALGAVRHLLAPNALHDLSLSGWHAAFSSATIHATPALIAKRKDLAFAGALGDSPDAAWSGEIDQALMPNSIADEIVFFHRKSGTVLFCDLLQQMPKGWYKGWRAVIARLDLMTANEPSVPRKFRMAMKRASARSALQNILAWPAEKVLMAHGTSVTQNARAFLARAFKWLKR